MSELQVIADVLEAWITEESTPEARRAFAETMVIDLAANGYRIVRSDPPKAVGFVMPPTQGEFLLLVEVRVLKEKEVR